MNGCGYADIEDWSKEYLIERYKDLVEIEKEHKKENGELRERIKELEKKDKIIDKMADILIGLPLNEKLLSFGYKEEVKGYFTNLVEKENI